MVTYIGYTPQRPEPNGYAPILTALRPYDLYLSPPAAGLRRSFSPVPPVTLPRDDDAIADTPALVRQVMPIIR